MRRTFIQTELFNRVWSDMGLGDDELAELQDYLMKHPEAGNTISETGGAKKVRIPLEGRGKSGGARVIYVDIVIKEKIYFLMAYAKNVQTDLTQKQKKMLRTVIEAIEKEEQ